MEERRRGKDESVMGKKSSFQHVKTNTMAAGRALSTDTCFFKASLNLWQLGNALSSRRLRPSAADLLGRAVLAGVLSWADLAGLPRRVVQFILPRRRFRPVL